MSTAAATPAPPVKPPSLAGTLDDFSDRLSPMLVKELRQGLRGKTFVIVFLTLQALLTFVLLIAVSAAPSTDAGHVVSSVIFFFYSLAVLVVQPLRGIGSLHHEIRGNTIDLMVLTRMSSWRIALGKWVAIVSQSGLLLAAIAPYLILRYFFGRMELFAELLLLALIFAGSAVFTAITVGLSAMPSIFWRGLLPLFLGVFLAWGICAVLAEGELKEMIGFCTLQDPGSAWALLAGVLTAAYAAWLALALGVSAIAPRAENHSSIRRLISLAAVVLLGLLGMAGKFDREATGPLLVLFCAPAVAIALTEPLTLMPPIVRPFLRYGLVGKLAGRILYPGWISGAVFSAVLVVVAIGAVLIGKDSADERLHISLVAALGTLLFPGVVLRLFSRKVQNPLPFYIFILVVTLAITVGIMIAAIQTDNHPFVWYFSWIPPVQVFLPDVLRDQAGHSATGPPDYSLVLKVAIGTAAGYLAILLACAFRNFPAIREVEEETTNTPVGPP